MGTTEDETDGWHHRLDGHEFEKVPGVGDGLEAWSAAVHGVTKRQTRPSDWNNNNNTVLHSGFINLHSHQ